MTDAAPPPASGARLAGLARSLGTSRIALWAAFVLVHLGLGLLNLYAPGYPIGDVTLVYKFWTDQALIADYWVGVDAVWVYPVVAIVPMLAAFALGPSLYASTWLTLVMLLDAVAFAAITGWLRSNQRPAIAWWWLAFLALLGPIALSRIDSVTVPLAIVGMLLLATRPRTAAVVLAVATWIKVWPAALLAAIVIAGRERITVVRVALFTSAGIVAVALAFGSGANVFSFITLQTGRGLQVEAPVTTLWLWRAASGAADTYVYYDTDILTFQVQGPNVAVVAAVMTPLLALAALAVLALGLRAVHRGAASTALLAPLALALVATLIAVNKVGSPQFIGWLAVPVVYGLAVQGRAFRTPALIALVLAGLTQAVYPYLYNDLLSLDRGMLVVLTARNLLLFVLLGWAVRSLVRIGRRPASPRRDNGGGHDDVDVLSPVESRNDGPGPSQQQ